MTRALVLSPVGQNRSVLLNGAAMLALLAWLVILYRETAASMFATWMAHDTYQYGVIVLPAFAWLLWQKRAEVLALPWSPQWWAWPIAIVAVAGWMAGELASARVISQLALVGMFAALVVALLGRERTRIALFPLAFLVFAVPFGESMVPRLMDWTADFTVAALRLSSIPVYREGLWFVLPSGTWSVIEACSGVKFLLTMGVLGTLYAYVMYSSWQRRLAFVAVALLTAIVANWLRAYLTVLTGHLSDNRLMSGEDHIVFGWVLFGVAMIALIVVGARFAQPQAATVPSSGGPASLTGKGARVVAILPLVTVSLGPMLLAPLNAAPAAPVAATAPVLVSGGNWAAVSGRVAAWSPVLVGPRAVGVQSFQHEARRVELHVAVFEQQRKGAELASAVNRLVQDADPVWKLAQESSVAVDAPALPAAVKQAQLRRGDRAYLVWQWMVSGGEPTLSLAKGKLDVVRARFEGSSDRGYWIAVLTEVDDAAPEAAADVLRRFAVDMGPAMASAFEVRR